MALQKKGPSAKKYGGHFLMFGNKVITKKINVLRGGHFLVVQNKVISKKNLILGGPLFKVPKQSGI